MISSPDAPVLGSRDPSTAWHLLVSEAALRWPLGSVLPAVRFGVLDLATPKSFAPPAAFHMYDRVVSVATEVGTSFLTDAADVEHFDGLFARLDAAALHGDDARELLARVVQQCGQ